MKADGEVGGALLVADHLHTTALGRLIDGGPPPGLPVIGRAGPVGPGGRAGSPGPGAPGSRP